MRAAVIVAPRTIDLRQTGPLTPSAGEVRVKIDGTGVCASNLPVWEGRPWFTYPCSPGAPGHEAWGVVDAIGPDVEHLAVGDRVSIISSHAYADYDLAPASAAARLPSALDGIDFPGEPLACACNAFERSGIRSGDRVAVVGIGFLGAVITALAVHAGAEVFAVSRRPFSRMVAGRLGARHMVPFDSAERAYTELTRRGGLDLDCAVEAVGTQEALDLAARLPRTRGRLVIAGYHQDGPRTIDLQSWNWRGIDVINAHERDPYQYLRGMISAIELTRLGVLNPASLCTHVLPLSELAYAFELLSTRPDGFLKAVVRMS